MTPGASPAGWPMRRRLRADRLAPGDRLATGEVVLISAPRSQHPGEVSVWTRHHGWVRAYAWPSTMLVDVDPAGSRGAS